MSGSRLFRRNRALGYVSNNVPSVIRYVKRRNDNLITTCIGRSFQVYTASHFRLLHVSAVHPDEITCLAVDRFHTYAASNKCIYAWRSGKHLRHVYKGHTKNIHLLMPFRSHLIAVDEDNVLKVWNISSETVYLEIPFKADDFKITALVHPPTYVNKILLGSELGSMQLWNIKENKLIYSFKSRGSRVTCIEAAPAIDVVGVGYHSGNIIILNLKYDEVIMEFNQDWGPVTKITFRTDEHPIMATACTNGHIAFWNLEERKITSQISAHHDKVTTAVCLPNEPLMLTSSPDNSMKLWIFDMSDGGARLLRIRQGHSAPPHFIRFHGAKGDNILSAGEDSSLRIFSTISETLNKSLGRASYNRKASKKKNSFEKDSLIMPPIMQFTSETTKEKEWDNIAAIHNGIIQTTTWSFDKVKMGELKLVPEQFYNKNRKNFKSEATCLVLTHCGNFVIIGYSTGDIERFNIQSGIHRGSYGKPAYNCAVRGIACDKLNQLVISGGSDGIVKFWKFKENAQPIAKLNLKNGITFFCSHRESSMVCIVLDNFLACILDLETKTIIRKFEGHTGKINDATFSPDSRWLITAAMDSTIKIWDIPSSYMIDHFQVEHPCVSLTMSPTGNFLASAHVNYLGIHLWANKMLYSQISLRSINPFSEAPYIDLPATCDEASLEDTLVDIEIKSEGEEINMIYQSPEQLSEELITLSGLSISRWQNLLDLDTIKQRNKPKLPPKTPKQAPFFLPTITGSDFKFDLSDAIAENEKSKHHSRKTFNNLTEFGKLLDENNQDFQKCLDYLKKLGPSMIDFEIKSLHPIGGGSYKVMKKFLEMIVFMFNSNANFELAQAYLASFLKVHSTSLIEKQELIDCLSKVEEEQDKSWKNIEKKFVYGLGVVNALRNYVI